MKKIIVPVDFSKLSDNATNYAVELALNCKAELTLVHVFYVPVMTSDAFVMLPTAHEIEKESLEKLKKMKTDIQKDNSSLNVHYYCTQGIPVNEIDLCATQKEADLIVIGAQGAGYLEERIFGSTATLLIRTTKIPVLVISKDVKFTKPEKIALAIDYAEIYNHSSMKALGQLAAIFNSDVSVLNVISGSEVTANAEIQNSLQLAHALKHIRHTYYRTQHPEIIAGINAFVKQHDIQLLTMIARRHSMLSRIFHEPQTKAMAFHTEVPLLVLHDKKQEER